MGIKELKHWIQSQLGPTRLEAISQKAIHLLQVFFPLWFEILLALHDRKKVKYFTVSIEVSPMVGECQIGS